MMLHGLRHGPPGPDCLHLCVDMQRLFGPGYPWSMAWFQRILPAVTALVGHDPARTIFTRFIPPRPPATCRAAGSATIASGTASPAAICRMRR